jgi:hypothetical protein
VVEREGGKDRRVRHAKRKRALHVWQAGRRAHEWMSSICTCYLLSVTCLCYVLCAMCYVVCVAASAAQQKVCSRRERTGKQPASQPAQRLPGLTTDC